MYAITALGAFVACASSVISAAPSASAAGGALRAAPALPPVEWPPQIILLANLLAATLDASLSAELLPWKKGTTPAPASSSATATVGGAPAPPAAGAPPQGGGGPPGGGGGGGAPSGGGAPGGGSGGSGPAPPASATASSISNAFRAENVGDAVQTILQGVSSVDRAFFNTLSGIIDTARDAIEEALQTSMHLVAADDFLDALQIAVSGPSGAFRDLYLDGRLLTQYQSDPGSLETITRDLPVLFPTLPPRPRPAPTVDETPFLRVEPRDEILYDSIIDEEPISEAKPLPDAYVPYAAGPGKNAADQDREGDAAQLTTLPGSPPPPPPPVLAPEEVSVGARRRTRETLAQEAALELSRRRRLTHASGPAESVGVFAHPEMLPLAQSVDEPFPLTLLYEHGDEDFIFEEDVEYPDDQEFTGDLVNLFERRSLDGELLRRSYLEGGRDGEVVAMLHAASAGEVPLGLFPDEDDELIAEDGFLRDWSLAARLLVDLVPYLAGALTASGPVDSWVGEPSYPITAFSLESAETLESTDLDSMDSLDSLDSLDALQSLDALESLESGEALESFAGLFRVFLRGSSAALRPPSEGIPVYDVDAGPGPRAARPGPVDPSPALDAVPLSDDLDDRAGHGLAVARQRRLDDEAAQDAGVLSLVERVVREGLLGPTEGDAAGTGSSDGGGPGPAAGDRGGENSGPDSESGEGNSESEVGEFELGESETAAAAAAAAAAVESEIAAVEGDAAPADFGGAEESTNRRGGSDGGDGSVSGPAGAVGGPGDDPVEVVDAVAGEEEGVDDGGDGGEAAAAAADAVAEDAVIAAGSGDDGEGGGAVGEEGTEGSAAGGGASDSPAAGDSAGASGSAAADDDGSAAAGGLVDLEASLRGETTVRYRPFPHTTVSSEMGVVLGGGVTEGVNTLLRPVASLARSVHGAVQKYLQPIMPNLPLQLGRGGFSPLPFKA